MTAECRQAPEQRGPERGPPRPEEFRDLLARERTLIEGLVRGGAGSRLLALYSVDDLVGEILCKAYRALERKPPIHPQAFKAWLATICRHGLSDLRRRHFKTKKRAGRVASIEDPVGTTASGSVLTLRDGLASPGHSPSSGAILRERARSAEMLLDRVPLRHREILRMTVFEGLESAEIARLIGKRPDAVRQMQVRALKAGRRALGELGMLPQEGSK